MRNKNIFCARKGGVTHNKGKPNEQFTPLMTSDILSRQIERDAAKLAHREKKR